MDETQRLIRAYCTKRDKQKKYYWEHYDRPKNTFGNEQVSEDRPGKWDEDEHKAGGLFDNQGRGPDKDE